jgi:hypothetical protein
MKSNDSLENLFKEFNPTMSSEQTFVNKLNRKLEAVEYIKQMQEHQAQRQRYTMFVAVVLCTIICTIVITLMQSESIVLSGLSFSLRALPYMLSPENLRVLSIIILSLSVSGAIIAIISIWYELGQWRDIRRLSNKA